MSWRCRCREEKGVKVRLEIGPKDAEQSICTIARSQPTPGLVAYKRPGDVNKKLAEQVRAMLDIPDAEVPAGDVSKYEQKQSEAQQDSGEKRYEASCATAIAANVGPAVQCASVFVTPNVCSAAVDQRKSAALGQMRTARQAVHTICTGATRRAANRSMLTMTRQCHWLLRSRP